MPHRRLQLSCSYDGFGNLVYRRQTSLACTLKHEAFLVSRLTNNSKSFRTSMKRGIPPIYSVLIARDGLQLKPLILVIFRPHWDQEVNSVAFHSRKAINALLSCVVLQSSGRSSDHSIIEDN
jgi:hypothetical protein